jgi:hypothetical protein
MLTRQGKIRKEYIRANFPRGALDDNEKLDLEQPAKHMVKSCFLLGKFRFIREFFGIIIGTW